MTVVTSDGTRPHAANVARPVMRHRLVTSFSAESDGVTPDHIVEKLFEAVREPLE